MNTKTNHIEKTRAVYAANAQKIMAFGLNDFDYNELIFNAGIAFLEQLYPRLHRYKNYYELFAYSKSYWTWFYSEFKLWEAELIEFMTYNTISSEDCLKEVMNIAHDGAVEISFRQNYLKHLKQI